MAAVTICSDFGAPKNKVWHCFHCFPIYFPWSDRTEAMIFVFWMLSFKPTFSLSTFTFFKRLLSSSSLSAIRVVSSAYLRLLIFLPAILILACIRLQYWVLFLSFVEVLPWKRHKRLHLLQRSLLILILLELSSYRIILCWYDLLYKNVKKHQIL